MARKESVTEQMILDTAFEMVKEGGFESITARKVAERAGCSTQPIFRVYKNMDELQHAVRLGVLPAILGYGRQDEFSMGAKYGKLDVQS